METKLLGVKRKDYDGGYTVWSFESEKGMSHCVQRDCGDYYEVTPLKSLDSTKPIIVPVGVPGGEHIPDEVKTVFNDGPPFKVPVTTLKFPKLPAADHIQREKVWNEIKAQGEKKMKREYDQAVDTALTRAKQEAAAVLAIKHVNLDTSTDISSVKLNKVSSIRVMEKGTGSSSDELMTDGSISIVEKVTESSSDELMKHNIVVEKVIGSSSDELIECKSACSFVGSGKLS